ncbi:MAG: nuclear transport factor 2 family protein [Nitrospiraceae bacterium]
MALIDNLQWIGSFTEEDRDQIDALRVAQVAAIEQGDADTYAQLCTDDILLLLQGQDLAAGRLLFIEREAALFRSAKFHSIRQTPIRIERHGNLAVEIGRQETTLSAGIAIRETFKAKRKYLHVLRKTSAGWRFACLMSNNSV